MGVGERKEKTRRNRMAALLRRVAKSLRLGGLHQARSGQDVVALLPLVSEECLDEINRRLYFHELPTVMLIMGGSVNVPGRGSPT
jgi:hypothetical protein